MKRLALISLIAAGAVAWPLPLGAQQPAMPVIGVLSSASAGLRTGEQFAAFDRGLREAGYIEGQNVRIEYRWANDDYARLPALAGELVRLRVAVIVAAGGQVSALAAHQTTKDIPIVFTTVTDPVRSGLVASLNRPGGNVTGTAGLTSELDPKRLELLREIKPSAKLIGVLVDPRRPGLENQLPVLHAAAEKMNLTLEVQEAGSEREIDTAFEKFARRPVNAPPVDALLVTADPYFNSRRAQVVALAAGLAVPAIYQWREFVSAGGLMSYGPSITDAYRQAAINAGRILKGAKPADLPVMQPTRFELVINRYTARLLGLTVSPALLSLADDVIE
jgi:putative ABC transport system substrate-binding protein